MFEIAVVVVCAAIGIVLGLILGNCLGRIDVFYVNPHKDTNQEPLLREEVPPIPERLKRCPCGGRAVLFGDALMNSVNCEVCNSSVMYIGDDLDLVAAWNAGLRGVIIRYRGGDYLEDNDDDGLGGNCGHKCVVCDRHFLGSKARTVCKGCVSRCDRVVPITPDTKLS